MKTTQPYRLITVICIMLISSQIVFADQLDNVLKQLQTPSAISLDEGTIITGLKEALSLGTAKAVKLVSTKNGYLGNETIKILLPENVQKMAEILKKAGYDKEVDAFVLSMNRAAEKAAPKAKPIFIDAVKAITFQDAKEILNGGNTAATNYFKNKTSTKLSEAFKPLISSSMNKVGVTRSYKAMTNRYLSILPLSTTESFDLDHYVTAKALNGLFHMLGEEESKIRTNPKARTTEILRKVFGK